MKRRPWTPEDDAHLRKFHAEGKDDNDIAYILCRNRYVIWDKRTQLGLPANAKGGGDNGISPEGRVKLSEAVRARWRDPAYRERMMPHMKRAADAARAKRIKPPPYGSPEYKYYRKVREELGRAAAHNLLNPSATT
jgi:hypothetical protein